MEKILKPLTFWSLCMSSDRLRQVAAILTRFREQVESQELRLTTIAPEERVRLKYSIADLKKDMCPYEEEYWQILADHPSTTIATSEPESEVVVAEIVEKVIQLQTSRQYSDEIMAWLQKIYLEVSKPGTPASAKLKGALSLLPPFVSLSYEAELDTERFLRKHFPTFTKWSNALAKKS